MRWIPHFQQPARSLKKKLFGYMLLLAMVLIITLLSGFVLFGRFDSVEKTAHDALELQMDVFEKDVFQHFDDLAAASIRLSRSMTELLEAHLKKNGLEFDDLADSETGIADVQRSIIDPIRDTLLQEDCSGVFVLLNTTVNTQLSGAEGSRAGVYLQVNGYDSSDRSVLLYRGQAQVGKEMGVMPHRKWRQEFDAQVFPDYAQIIKEAALPLEKTYRFTELVTLPGTSEKVMLAVAPIVGSKGEVYGLCGYEVSESYFTAYHAQMTKVRHLTGLVTHGDADRLDTEHGLSCGVAQGYYRAPQGQLQVSNVHGGLKVFRGDAVPYIGVQRKISLSPNNEEYVLSVMMLKSDYDSKVRSRAMQNIVITALVLFFAVNFCLYFSRRFLKPVLEALERIKADEHEDVQSQVAEINDLFAFLAERDRDHEEAMQRLEQEKQQAQAEKERLQSEYERAQSKYEAAYAKIHRIENATQPEVDPEEYSVFLDGIQKLTPMERRVFEYYLEGKTVSQIIEIASIKESTLRYHNRNIYNKLGVSSLKQLLRYAQLMKTRDE